MKYLLVVGAIALTIVCWGIYGPVLHWGQEAMNGGQLLPFLFVGVAYFLIGVAVPVALLNAYGEKGQWTTGGTFWSLLAGAAGAIGALGIIVAFGYSGQPIYVMPLVFGGAPIVNSFLTVYMGRAMKSIGPVFLAGLIMVLIGSVTVLISKPEAAAAAAHGTPEGPTFQQWVWIFAAVATTIIFWGMYGPVLHKGQVKMGGSRLRPLICVGLAYFAIAVAVPAIMLTARNEWGAFTVPGSFWSLAAGAAGALGALGIIMAFNFGGKPVFVMPLVFAGAPVVNTLTTITARSQFGQIGPLFYAGLIIVAAGAAIVLVFAPKGAAPPAEVTHPPDRESEVKPETERVSEAETGATESDA
ncbi:MAG: hypothetical protein WBF93_20665 [Pirellulales bacterium]